MTKAYPEFEIRIGPELGEGHPFIAQGPDQQPGVLGYFASPFAREEVDTLLSALMAGCAAPANGQATLLERVGGALYQALFDQPARQLYDRCLASAGGRLRLKLTTTEPALACLPWEYLHDGQRFLGMDLETPIVRGVITRPWPNQPARPLRLLILGSSPLDQAPLEIAREHDLIQRELAKLASQGQMVVKRLDGQRIVADLPQLLLEFAPHVLHFAGHGNLEGILLEDERGNSRPLTGASLRDLLGNIKSLQLVVLNACQVGGVGGARDRLSVAARLVQLGLPMAVGMQFPISDAAALAFSEGFYEALAQRLPLEAAAVWARVRISYYLSLQSGQTYEWGTPVIYSPAAPWRIDWRQVMARATQQRAQRQRATLPAHILGRDGKAMRLIPAGNFIMGTDHGPEDERPQHQVPLPAYWMDVQPVTNAEYAQFVQATGRKAPPHWPDGEYPPEKMDHPVVNVSWEDAQAYARWAGKRLPTEAEWEKAARGTDGRAWPWGPTFHPSRCNSRESGSGDTSPVGSHSPQGDSPYGLADMAGNVWEWTADLYRPYPGSTYACASYAEPNRVLRGGSWSYGRDYARCAARTCDYPDFIFASYGFRCVIDVKMYLPG